MTEHQGTDVDQSLDRACVAIRGAAQVALACHVSPDGDALGSMLGLFHVLRDSSIDCVASFPTPFIVAPHYRMLPGLDRLTPPHEFPSEPDVMVTFVELNPDAAVCLYTALVCDTGRFQYDSTTPEVFELARELVAYGVPVPDVSRTLFEEHRFAYMQLLGEVLGSAHLVPERRFVWTAVTQDLLNKHQVTMEEVEGLIDILRRTREANVSCVVKEEGDGTVRVSLRSLGEVDVCRIAQSEGGGGHRFAAGFTSDDDIDEVVNRIQRKLPLTP